WKTRGPQERGPIYGVESNDLLADQVQLGGPQVFARHGGHVSGQRIEPHVEDVRRVAFDGYAPLDRGPADRKVAQALLYERDHFVAARLGKDEIGLVFVELQQPVLEFGELEIEILFGDRLRGPSAIRARIAGFRFADVEFVEDAILSGVGAFVDITVLETPVEQVLDHAGVLGVGGALEPVDLQAQDFPLPAEFLRNEIGELLRRPAGGAGGALDLLAMLVGAGGEDYRLEALHALKALDRVGGDGRIGVADVRSSVDVVDRRGEVVFAHFGFVRYASCAAASTRGSGTPVRWAIALQSSNSGANVPCEEIFPRTRPYGVSTSTTLRGSMRRSAEWIRRPRVDVSAKII